MKYMGSKRRIAKHLLPIILKGRKPGQWYVEPFVGGANMIEHVDGPRIGADSNSWAIDALRHIRDHRTPKGEHEFSESDYKSVCDAIRGKSALPFGRTLCAYAAFSLSYGGKFLGGWCRGRGHGGRIRDYVNESHKSSERQRKLIQGVGLICAKYDDLEIPSQSIIYCDPPYAGTTKYRDDFDHDKFWQWCRDKATDGHKVFISEYSAPDDFVCVWAKEQASSLTRDTGAKKGVERLFVHRSQNA